MGDRTGIEWTDATWNPVSGCSKVSQGCKHCYAERVFPRPYPGRKFTDVRMHPLRLRQPLQWQKPRRIFVNSMSDLFHEDVPTWFIDQVFAVMLLAPRHTFQVLTKRPERMCTYLSDPHLYARTLQFADEYLRVERPALGGVGISDPSLSPAPWIWLGVSVEDQATADERIPLLLQTPAAVRFLSCEPLLSEVDLRRLCSPYEIDALNPESNEDTYYETVSIDWVIVGGESGTHARPMHPAWVRSLRDQCVSAGVPFFFKQWGEHQPGSDFKHDEHTIILDRSGHIVDDLKAHEDCGGFSYMRLVGKKAAGRELDGRTWDEYPEVRQ